MHWPGHERDRQILALWERGVGLSRWPREDALLAGAGGAPQTLGARNAALLALRAALFDRRWPLTSRCPACGSDCGFEVDAGALADDLRARAAPGERALVEWSGRPIELRPPTAEDLHAVSTLSPAAAARSLLARCIGGDVTIDDIDEQTLADLGSRLEQLDPAALVSFELRCPDCSHAWSGDIDVGEALWSEVRRSAERALIEIDALARTYGWTESEVLRLSPVRRAAYLQLAGAS